MESLTPNPQQSISAAFDSVNLINNTILETLSNDNKSTVKRNVQHLEIMLSKEWFSEALTEQQLIDINSCIANGNSYEIFAEETPIEEPPTEETVTEEV